MDVDDDKDAIVESRNKSAVKHLTESDLDNYSIYDIVLPQPGYSIVLPDNEVSVTRQYQVLVSRGKMSFRFLMIVILNYIS